MDNQETFFIYNKEFDCYSKKFHILHYSDNTINGMTLSSLHYNSKEMINKDVVIYLQSFENKNKVKEFKITFPKEKLVSAYNNLKNQYSQHNVKEIDLFNTIICETDKNDNYSLYFQFKVYMNEDNDESISLTLPSFNLNYYNKEKVV
tara:strand:- start:4078 stop:4521 length:444 start_codon:yes stop_codon:yes gene_type:complete